jgi:shikimate dehydrogenase
MVTGETVTVGIIGYPVGHSLSPAMHNAAFQALAMDWIYIPLPVTPERLEHAVRGLAALGFRGTNVTVPHKERVIPFLDRLSIEASAIGSVNTISLEKGLLVGDNTDSTGFIAHLEEMGFDPAGCNAMILGSGGSARSVAYALAKMGAALRVSSRNAKSAAALVWELKKLFPSNSVETVSVEGLGRHGEPVDLLVNTTPVGMAPNVDASPWPEDVVFPKCRLVYDLVYNPPKTRFLEQAERTGSATMNGLGMLVHQAAVAFRIWTGRDAPIAVMREAAGMGADVPG